MPLTPWECPPCSCDQETILFSTVAATCPTGLTSHSWRPLTRSAAAEAPTGTRCWTQAPKD